MSAVGIVSIAVGVFSVCARFYTLVAPAATLLWLKKITRTNASIRKMGATGLALGGAMIWAGASEETGLAGVLLFFGWAIAGMCTTLLVVFPGGYRAIIDRALSVEESDFLIFLRGRSVVGIIIGALLIYFGARAL